MSLTSKQKLKLIQGNTEEILTEEDLVNVLSNDLPLRHYIGFEISGKIHLGTGIMCMSKVKDFLNAGVECSIFLADWHTWINDKLGGDKQKIKEVAVGYFKEGLKAAFKCVGGNPENLNFVLGSDLYHNNDRYWETVIEVSKNTTLSRIKRSLDILGRKKGEAVDFAKLIYPSMQVADIFAQDITLAHSGMDQRKAHVIMRQVAPKIQGNNKKVKPIAVHHHLLLGLLKPPVWPIPSTSRQELWVSMKMSKSIPQSAVFINDSPDDIRKKVKAAFCPPKETEFNPIMDWIKHLVFSQESANLVVKRSRSHGGNIKFNNFKEVEIGFKEGKLHPEDLKTTIADKVVKLLEPARKHFEKPGPRQMLNQMEALIITR